MTTASGPTVTIPGAEAGCDRFGGTAIAGAWGTVTGAAGDAPTPFAGTLARLKAGGTAGRVLDVVMQPDHRTSDPAAMRRPIAARPRLAQARRASILLVAADAALGNMQAGAVNPFINARSLRLRLAVRHAKENIVHTCRATYEVRPWSFVLRVIWRGGGAGRRRDWRRIV